MYKQSGTWCIYSEWWLIILEHNFQVVRRWLPLPGSKLKYFSSSESVGDNGGRARIGARNYENQLVVTFYSFLGHCLRFPCLSIGAVDLNKGTEFLLPHTESVVFDTLHCCSLSILNNQVQNGNVQRMIYRDSSVFACHLVYWRNLCAELTGMWHNQIWLLPLLSWCEKHLAATKVLFFAVIWCNLPQK